MPNKDITKTYVARDAWSNSPELDGAVDELVVYDRILSNEELKCLKDDACEYYCETCA